MALLEPGEPGRHFTTMVVCWRYSRDRIVVSTSRCGRDNPGSNPGHGRGCEVSIRLSQPVFYECFYYLEPLFVTTDSQKYKIQLEGGYTTYLSVSELSWES